MQIVIDIPEIVYDLFKSDAPIDWLDAENILNRIAEGIVLPKGHGDLIDRSKIKWFGCDIIKIATMIVLVAVMQDVIMMM